MQKRNVTTFVDMFQGAKQEIVISLSTMSDDTATLLHCGLELCDPTHGGSASGAPLFQGLIKSRSWNYFESQRAESEERKLSSYAMRAIRVLLLLLQWYYHTEECSVQKKVTQNSDTKIILDISLILYFGMCDERVKMIEPRHKPK